MPATEARKQRRVAKHEAHARLCQSVLKCDAKDVPKLPENLSMIFSDYDTRVNKIVRGQHKCAHIYRVFFYTPAYYSIVREKVQSHGRCFACLVELKLAPEEHRPVLRELYEKVMGMYRTDYRHYGDMVTYRQSVDNIGSPGWIERMLANELDAYEYYNHHESDEILIDERRLYAYLFPTGETWRPT